VTPEAINFMAKHACGLICVPLSGERVDELGLPLMTQNNTEKMGTAFTISVDAKGRGVTTGSPPSTGPRRSGPSSTLGRP
jgi:3,4-dihydroxy 2-butanone 4-phosphate synthase/GTP cyclohydrolase II